MKRLWSLLGRLAFWLSYPALFVYLYRSQRTRILIICGGEVLVSKGWLGLGRWELPGGGRHRRETAIQGALRELYEETGMKIKPEQLKLIHEQRSIPEAGLTFSYTAFALELLSKPTVLRQKYELADLKWFKWQDLLTNKAVSPNVRSIIAVWFKT